MVVVRRRWGDGGWFPLNAVGNALCSLCAFCFCIGCCVDLILHDRLFVVFFAVISIHVGNGVTSDGKGATY